MFDEIAGTHESATHDPSIEIDVRRQTAPDVEISPTKNDIEVGKETTTTNPARRSGEKLNWILWVGMACASVTMCVIAYIIYKQRNVNIVVQQVISYSK